MEKVIEQDVSDIINKFNIKLLDKYVDRTTKMAFLDIDGYKLYTSINYLKNTNSTKIFSKKNPYTIYNINHYIDKNNIKCQLLSDSFYGSSDKLLWKCSCGNTYYKSWNSFSCGAHMCKKCSNKSGAEKRKNSYDFICNSLKSKGYIPIFDAYDSTKQIEAIDPDGYKVLFRYRDFSRGHIPQPFNTGNIYTIDNIKLALKKYTDDNFEYLRGTYKSNRSLLEILHKNCNNTFKIKWVDLQRITKTDKTLVKGTLCPYCTKKRLESTHALVLKQLFLQLKQDGTVIEDKSCRNPKTGYPLPTDIVNHKEKIAIEIQSNFHDKKEQKIKDMYKKQFWIDKGYKFYDPDIRKYTIIEMAQIFFPNITKIPDWIHFNFNNKLDMIKVQQLLNDGYSLKEISKILNVKHSRLNGAINRKDIFYPYGNFNNRRKVIQLSLNDEYIMTFDSLYDVEKILGFKYSTISNALNGQTKTSKGFKWIYEDKYLEIKNN